MNKPEISKYELPRLERLKKSLPLNKKYWSKEMYAYLETCTMINFAPMNSTLIVYDCILLEQKTESGIILLEGKQETNSQIAMVVAIAPDVEFKGVKASLGDFILYSKDNIKCDIQMGKATFQIIYPVGVLGKLPEEMLNQVVVGADPLGVFKVSVAEQEAMKKKSAMPSRPKEAGDWGQDKLNMSSETN